jgi:hypothetical protein
LQVENGKGQIASLDGTQCVLSLVSMPLPGLAKGNYGITELNILIKFLKSCQDEEISYSFSRDKKWLTFRRKGHGKFSVLLVEEDLVAGSVKGNPDEIGEEVAEYKCVLPIKARFIEDALYYMGLIGQQGVEFKIDKGKVTLSSTAGGTQYFEVTVGSTDKSIDGVSVRLYSEQLQSVLQQLEIQEKSTMYIKEDKPVIFSQDEGNHWGLFPII